MEVGNNGSAGLSGGELGEWVSTAENEAHLTHLAQEPSDNVTEHDGLIGLVVVTWSWDTREVPQIGLPFVHSSQRVSGSLRAHTSELTGCNNFQCRTGGLLERLQSTIFRKSILRLVPAWPGG